MAAPSEPGMEINLATLSIQQLDQLRGSLVNEIQILQQSLSSLKMVQQSFTASEQAVDQLKPIEANKEILVPLTGSLYVPGKLISSDRVLIDIGTGYYIQKQVDEAKKYFNKKIAFMSKQIEQLSPVLQQKAMTRDDVMEIMQYKQQMQQAVQKQAAAAGPAQ